MRTKFDSKYLICTKCKNTIIIAKHPHAIPQYLPNIYNPYKDPDGLLNNAKVVLNKNITNPLNRTTGLLENIFNPLVDPYVIEKEFERFLKIVAKREFNDWKNNLKVREKEVFDKIHNNKQCFDGYSKDKILKNITDNSFINPVEKSFINKNTNSLYNQSKQIYNMYPKSSKLTKLTINREREKDPELTNLKNYSEKTDKELLKSLPEYYYKVDEDLNPYKNNIQDLLYKEVFERSKIKFRNISGGLGDGNNLVKNNVYNSEVRNLIKQRSDYSYKDADENIYNPQYLSKFANKY